MHIDSVLENLWKDYEDYSEKRKRAIRRCNTEYVADLDSRIRITRERILGAKRVKKSGLDQGMVASYTNAETQAAKHELIEWLEKTAQDAKLATERLERKNRDPITGRIHSPAYGDWERAALRFVKSGSTKDYNEMLSLVRLTHPVPNLWNESETKEVNQKTTTTKAFTLADFWDGARGLVALFLAIGAAFFFIVWGISS